MAQHECTIATKINSTANSVADNRLKS